MLSFGINICSYFIGFFRTFWKNF